MQSFLTQNEINSIFADFDALLNSPEATTITMKWITAHSQPIDPRYGKYPTTDVPTWATQDIKAIVQLVKPTDKAYLDTGILKSGDLIFYCKHDVVFDSKEAIEFEYNSKPYYPLIPTPEELDSLVTPLGNSQLAQMVYATSVKEKR